MNDTKSLEEAKMSSLRFLSFMFTGFCYLAVMIFDSNAFAARPPVSRAPQPVTPAPQPEKPANQGYKQPLCINKHLRERFISGSKLTEDDSDRLRDSSWRCISHGTACGIEKNQHRIYNLNFSRNEGLLSVESELTGQSKRLGFTKEYGMTAIHEVAGYPSHFSRNVFRLTKNGNLVIENSGSVKDTSWSNEYYPTSVLRSDWTVGAYAVCTRERQGSFSLDQKGPGHCKKQDQEFSSEEGGCYSFKRGIAFSMSPPWADLTYDFAKKYCDELEEGGKANWQLPAERDFVSIAGAKGALGHLNFSVNRRFWTKASGTTPKAVWVDLASGTRRVANKIEKEAAVVCVYKAIDTDKDGVPDATDLCPGTPIEQLSQTVGAHKGCSSEQIEKNSATQAKG